MGRKNYLIEGVSGTGKTAVCEELKRRGFHAINGDRELAYQGNPETGRPVAGVTGISVHDHHIWDVDSVRAQIADESEAVTFFCGGSRNFPKFIDLFDGVFVLELDPETLYRRLNQRTPGEWGGRPEEREMIKHLHRTGEDVPGNAIKIDATVGLAEVVDAILSAIRTI
ncbi:gluconate kinase [Arthrobacter pascens]|uniref:AAA family ATPase n=1 Tax=Arthrobacter pascens TaxID=1677 RepID=UPI002786B3B1|nr:AAA family ATPase [Arthrobacter pascens]MDQ0632377.1 gluconate kinase [Arthrobacter pascens]